LRVASGFLTGNNTVGAEPVPLRQWLVNADIDEQPASIVQEQFNPAIGSAFAEKRE